MPTVIIGENDGDDFAGCEDTGLWGASNHGNESASYIGSSGYYVSLIKFSGLSNIPSTASVSTATLYLYVNYAAGGAGINCSVKRSLRNWVETEATDTLYATGNAWDSTKGRTDGTDRSSTESGPMGFIVSTGAYQNFTSVTFSADTEDFIDGTYSNYGWHFDEVSGPVIGFDTSEYGSTTSARRPYLSVSYTTAAAAFSATFKRYGGASWVSADLQHYGGASWADPNLNVYDGATWQSVDTSGT